MAMSGPQIPAPHTPAAPPIVQYVTGNPNGVIKGVTGNLGIDAAIGALWVNTSPGGSGTVWVPVGGGGGCPECECVEDATLFYDDFESYFIENINGESIVHSDVHWLSSPSGVDDQNQGGGWIGVFSNLISPQRSFVVGPVGNPLKMTTRLFGSVPDQAFIGFDSPNGQFGFGAFDGQLIIVALGQSGFETGIPFPTNCDNAVRLELIADLTEIKFFINGNLVHTVPTHVNLTTTIFDFRWVVGGENSFSIIVDMVCIRGPRRCVNLS